MLALEQDAAWRRITRYKPKLRSRFDVEDAGIFQFFRENHDKG